MQTRTIIAALATTALLSSCASTGGNAKAGSSFPKDGQTVEMIVPFAPGGSTDTVARLVAPRLEEEMGISVQVLNRPEGNGQTGLAEIADAPADGSTIGSVNLPSIFTSYLDPNTDVDYDRDSFQPLGAVAGFGGVLVVNADSDYKTFDDLVQAARAEPKSINLAAGAVDDLLPVTKLQDALDVEFNLIPFEGGSAGKVTTLLGKKVDVIIAAPSAVLANVDSGDLRVLSILGSERSTTFPDVQTATEQGFDVVSDTINGFGLPAGAPDGVVEAYQSALKSIADDPEFVDAVQKLGFNADYLSAQALGQEWDTQQDDAEPIITQQ